MGNAVSRCITVTTVIDGENAVRLGLSNQHEDFLYDDAGNNKTGNVTSQATVYDGASPVSASDVTWAIVSDQSKTYGVPTSGADVPTLVNGLLTVKALTANTAKVTIKATYPKTNGQDYYAEFTANKRTQDVYNLDIQPNIISYNTSNTFSPTTITIKAHRVSIDGSQADITTFNSDLLYLAAYLKSGSTFAWHTIGTNGTISPAQTVCAANDNILIELRKVKDGATYSVSDPSTYTVEDFQTIDIAKYQNGANGTKFQRIYRSLNDYPYPYSVPEGNTPAEWSTTPTAISSTARYRYVSERTSEDGGATWTGWSTPQVDAYMPEDGRSISIRGSVIDVHVSGAYPQNPQIDDIVLENGTKQCHVSYYDGSGWQDGMPDSSAINVGEGFILKSDGHLWVLKTDSYVAGRWEDVGQIKGDDGANGKDAHEINPNILLRTIFDKGIDFVQEKWTLNPSYVNIDAAADTVVEGRKSIRLNAQNNTDGVGMSQSVLGKIKPNTWYTVSFNAFRTAGGDFVMSFNNVVSGARHLIYDGDVIVDGVATTISSGTCDVIINGAWDGARHTVTFKTRSSEHISTTQLDFVFWQGYAQSSDANHSQTAICMPKMELGEAATAYVAHEADLVGKYAPYEEKQYANYNSDSVDQSGAPSGTRQGSWSITIPATSNSYPYLWERVRQRTYDDDNVLVPLGDNEGWTYGLLTKPGAKGSTGRMDYPAGEYTDAIEYRRTDDVCPVVHYTDGFYWYLDADTNWPSGTQASAVAPSNTSGNPWKKAEHYGMVITEALFAMFGKLGSFVYAEDFCISQYGTLFGTNGAIAVTSQRTEGSVYIGTDGLGKHIPYLALPNNADKPCYTYFSVADPMAETLPTSGNYKFRPMKVVNALTGEEWMAEGKVHVDADGNVEVTGVIRATTLYQSFIDYNPLWGSGQYVTEISASELLSDIGGTLPNILWISSRDVESHRKDLYTAFEIHLPNPSLYDGHQIEIICSKRAHYTSLNGDESWNPGIYLHLPDSSGHDTIVWSNVQEAESELNILNYQIRLVSVMKNNVQKWFVLDSRDCEFTYQ